MVSLSLLGRNFVQLLLQPVFAVYIAGDDIAGNIVAGGIDHGGRGVHQVADGLGDGEGDGQLLGEEQRAEHQLAGAAAAGAARCISPARPFRWWLRVVFPW